MHSGFCAPDNEVSRLCNVLSALDKTLSLHSIVVVRLGNVLAEPGSYDVALDNVVAVLDNELVRSDSSGVELNSYVEERCNVLVGLNNGVAERDNVVAEQNILVSVHGKFVVLSRHGYGKEVSLSCD